MALEEKGHNYEIGDTIETEEVAFVPMTKEIDDETAYNAFGRSHQRAEITMLLS